MHFFYNFWFNIIMFHFLNYCKKNKKIFINVIPLEINIYRTILKFMHNNCLTYSSVCKFFLIITFFFWLKKNTYLFEFKGLPEQNVLFTD